MGRNKNTDRADDTSPSQPIKNQPKAQTVHCFSPDTSRSEGAHCEREIEIDIRSLKTHMKMEHLRCQSPEMVRKEIYSHMLAYNLVRRVIVESALIFDKLPRQLSFKGAVQALNAFMSVMTARGRNIEQHYQCMLLSVSQNEIGDRPNRIEPRKVKRRPKSYKLLNEPRAAARKRAG